MVLVDRLADGGFDYVASPNRQVSHDLTQTLFGMGYENIAVFSEKLKHITPRIDRYRGYSDAAAEAGIAPVLCEIDENDPLGCCREHLAGFVSGNPGRRLAVICSNGVAALNVILAAQELGIERGSDFGCVTFDDWQWLKLSRPHISAVNLGTEEKGYKAAELLIKRIKGSDIPDELRRIKITPTVVLRSSTVPAVGKK